MYTETIIVIYAISMPSFKINERLSFSMPYMP